MRVQHSQGGHFRNKFQDVVELFRISPDLAIGNPEQALAEQAQVGVGDAEYAADAGAKRLRSQARICHSEGVPDNLSSNASVS
jgi:hypothetical protein